MSIPVLSPTARHDALQEMASGPELDVLVIGGGVTGAGIAVDAATRGLRVGIVEAQDWASGTSSRSSKLVHGGLRYLYQLDFKLVNESLRERGLLLTQNAPHLVKAQPFLWPLKIPVIERTYSAIGVGMYDVLAQFAHRGSVPIQKHYSKKGSLKLAPAIKPDALTGSIVYYDARVDDARLVVTLVRTTVRWLPTEFRFRNLIRIPPAGFEGRMWWTSKLAKTCISKPVASSMRRVCGLRKRSRWRTPAGD